MALAQVLRPLQNIFLPEHYPDLLTGLNPPDDAAIWKLDDERALAVTTDFFTPVVDDPYDFGQIAATNSLSDIYAMGGEPFLALNIAAMPPQLPGDIISEILRGGAEKAKEAGVVIAGGHTVQDKEPKYGLVVLGFIKSDRILSKSGMQPGDFLFLTKPIGSGVVAAAIKNEIIKSEDTKEMIAWLKRLNRDAATLALRHGSKAATDITGFSLLGHAWEMAAASHAGIRFDFASIPLFPHVLSLASEWCFPGGSFDNAEYYDPHVQFAPHITQDKQMLLFDPQTSGGLLFSITPENANQCIQEAREKNIPLWKIGEVTSTGIIEVV
ncbi:MAG: selenide, water dikinase SelD [Anaerolineales bacterium]|nr:selenide, water dikinase SelD [Anaerolineales bacterium]